MTIDELGIAIEDLAAMTARGFKEMLDEMNGRFAQVDGRLHRVDERLTNVERRLEKVEDKLDGVDNRLNGVEVALGDVRSDIRTLFSHDQELTGRVQTSESVVLSTA